MTRSASTTAIGLLFAAGVFGASPSALGQTFDSAIRLDQLQPASAGSPFVRAEGPRERFDAGVGFAARLIGEYMLEPLKAGVVGTTGAIEPVSLVKHAGLVHAGGQFSPNHWLNLELNVPFAVYEKGTPIDSVNGEQLPAGKMGVGDIRVGAHVLPINTREFDLQLGARFWAPTGSEAAYLQGPSRLFRVEAVVAAAGETDRFLYGCTLGIAPMWFAGRDGDRLAASCAGAVRLGSVVQFGVEPHVAAFTYRADPSQKTLAGLGDARLAIAFEPMGSVGFRTGDFLVQVAGGAGLGDAPGTAVARGMVNLTYAARAVPPTRVVEESDRDVDGIADRYDACPDEAGTEERRGCPEKRDQDGDSIVEGDACPNDPGARYDDPKANGCPDRDNDHIADPVDQCQTEPGAEPAGCPKYARLKDKAFVVTPPLAFGQTSERLGSTQVASLIEIVRTIRANPNIGSFVVKVGAKGAASKLTDARAAGIRTLLNEQNLETNRYELVLDDKLANGNVEVVLAR